MQQMKTFSLPPEASSCRLSVSEAPLVKPEHFVGSTDTQSITYSFLLKRKTRKQHISLHNAQLERCYTGPLDIELLSLIMRGRLASYCTPTYVLKDALQFGLIQMIILILKYLLLQWGYFVYSIIGTSLHMNDSLPSFFPAGKKGNIKRKRRIKVTIPIGICLELFQPFGSFCLAKENLKQIV